MMRRIRVGFFWLSFANGHKALNAGSGFHCISLREHQIDKKKLARAISKDWRLSFHKLHWFLKHPEWSDLCQWIRLQKGYKKTSMDFLDFFPIQSGKIVLNKPYLFEVIWPFQKLWTLFIESGFFSGSYFFSLFATIFWKTSGLIRIFIPEQAFDYYIGDLLKVWFLIDKQESICFLGMSFSILLFFLLVNHVWKWILAVWLPFK